MNPQHPHPKQNCIMVHSFLFDVLMEYLNKLQFWNNPDFLVK